MSELTTEQAARKVDLSDQITARLINGFDISPEDIREAEQLGLDIAYIAEVVGACYESGESVR